MPVTLESLEETSVWTGWWAHNDEKDLFQYYLVNMMATCQEQQVLSHSDGDLVQGLEGTRNWRNLGRMAGDSLSLGTKCWLSVGRCMWYHILEPISKLHGYSCTIAYFVSLWFEFCRNSRYCRSSVSPTSCWVWVCPLAQQTVGMSDSYMQLLQPLDNRPMLLVSRSWSLLSYLLFLSFSFSFTATLCNDVF